MTTFILWVPTLLFVLMVLMAIIMGVVRGFRKSLILFIQAIVAFVIVLIAYLIIVNNKSTDTWVVSMLKNFGLDLNNAFGVSSEYKSLTEILAHAIINNMAKNDTGKLIELVITDNMNYIYTLVNFIYHIIFAIVGFIVFFILDFIFYIIYLIFYQERRHKKKVIEKKGINDYKSHRILGLVTGAVRGLVVGLVFLSFLGSVLYVVAGGTGENKYKDTTLGSDKTSQTFYSIYTTTGSYGSTGIYKVLNSLKDSNGVPYYLAISNIVFSGKLEDENFGINQDVHFTEEFGDYIGLIRETFDLILEINPDIYNNISFSSNGGSTNIGFDQQALIDVFKTEEFKQGFDKIVEGFNENIYFLNFGLSMVDSVVQNVDELVKKDDSSQGINEDVAEIIKVLFKDGYKSPYIPGDTNSEANKQVIKLNQLLTKKDIANIIKAAFSLLSTHKEATMTELIKVYSDSLVPVIENLSILQDERKEEINPVLVRLFTAIDNMSLKKRNPETYDTLEKVQKSANEGVEWSKEIRNIVGTADNLVTLISNVGSKITDSNSFTADLIVEAAFDIFNPADPNYEENSTQYNEIENVLKKSKVLGKLLGLSISEDFIKNLIKSNYENAYIPTNINYVDVYNGDVLVEKGETSALLDSIRAIFSNQNNKTAILNILKAEDTYALVTSIIDLCRSLNTPDSTSNKPIDYLLSSKILSATLSSVILGKKDFSSDFTIYIPDSSYEYQDDLRLELIKTTELKGLISLIPDTLDLLKDFLNPDSEDYQKFDKVIDKFTDDVIDMIGDNNILEGTISDFIRRKVESSNSFDLPNKLLTTDDWVSLNELPNALRGIKAIGGSFTDILAGNADFVKTLNNDKIDRIYNSELLKSVISRMLNNVFKDKNIIDNEVLNVIITEDELHDTVADIDEIKALVNGLNEIDLSLNLEGSDMNNVITDKIKLFNNDSTTDPTRKKIDVLYDSLIVRSLYYKTLNGMTGDDKFLILDEDAVEKAVFKTNPTNINQITLVEAKALTDFTSSLGDSFDFGSVSMENVILTDDVITAMSNSLIIRRSTTKVITDSEDIKIISNDYADNKIVKEEFVNFFKGLKDGLDITNFSTISADDVHRPTETSKKNAVLNSNILKATISSKINFNDEDVYVPETDIVSTTDYKNQTLIILTNTELNAFLDAIDIIQTDPNSFDCDVSISALQGMDSTSRDKVLSSDIFRVVISNIDAVHTYAEEHSIPESGETIVNLTTGAIDTTRYIYSKTNLETIIESI